MQLYQTLLFCMRMGGSGTKTTQGDATNAWNARRLLRLEVSQGWDGWHEGLHCCPPRWNTWAM